MNTVEFKKYIKEVCEKEENHQKFIDRWLDKFHDLTPEKRLEIIKKIDKKYKSEEYIKRFDGMEPPNTLLSWLFDYGDKYGEEIEYLQNGYFGEEQYKIDDSVVISRMYGQGDFDYLIFLDEDLEKRKLRNDFHNDLIKLFNKYNNRLKGKYTIKGNILFEGHRYKSPEGDCQEFTIDCSDFDIIEPKIY